MQQSNALRRLEAILDEAVVTGDRTRHAGLILLEAMKLSNQSQNVMDFYEPLNKAEEESRILRNLPKIDRYIQTLVELHQVFVVNHIWSTSWQVFASHIESRGVLIALDALANYFHTQNPAIFLEQDFLENLNSEFEVLLNNVLESDLSKELKLFLIKRIEDILAAIRRYNIDGTEGLKKSAQALVSDLMITEHILKDVDKKNPTYMNVETLFLSLLLYITPTPWDIIGAVPDIDGFWVPKYEELVAGQKKVEQIVCEAPKIQDAFEKASNTFNRQPQKSLTGSKTVKALPASKEEVEADKDNKSAPNAQ